MDATPTQPKHPLPTVTVRFSTDDLNWRRFFQIHTEETRRIQAAAKESK